MFIVKCFGILGLLYNWISSELDTMLTVNEIAHQLPGTYNIVEILSQESQIYWNEFQWTSIRESRNSVPWWSLNWISCLRCIILSGNQISVLSEKKLGLTVTSLPGHLLGYTHTSLNIHLKQAFDPLDFGGNPPPRRRTRDESRITSITSRLRARGAMGIAEIQRKR